jgi:hypothetical protein
LFSFPRTGRSGGRAGIGNAVDNTDTGEWEESMPALNSNEDYNGNIILFFFYCEHINSALIHICRLFTSL